MRQRFEDSFFSPGQITTLPGIASCNHAVQPGSRRFRLGSGPLQVQHVGMGFPVAFPGEPIEQTGCFDKLRIIRHELAQVLDRHFGIAKFSQHRGINEADQKVPRITRQPDQGCLAGKLKFAVA